MVFNLSISVPEVGVKQILGRTGGGPNGAEKGMPGRHPVDDAPIRPFRKLALSFATDLPIVNTINTLH